MNSKFLSLPIKELHNYVRNLEKENEKLKNDLSIIYRFNCILENIKRSHHKGYTAMKCIDRNKNCNCQEHLNVHLRRIEHEADIELSVWMEQYEKLIINNEKDIMSIQSDNSATINLINLNSPESSSCISLSDDGNSTNDNHDSVMSEPEITITNEEVKNDGRNSIDNSSIENNNNNNSSCLRNCLTKDKTNNSTYDENKVNEENIEKNVESPQIVYNENYNISQSENYNNNNNNNNNGKQQSNNNNINNNNLFKCDWPNCFKSFFYEENLIRHRRNHIRKSLYHCEHCGLRFLDNQELQSHLKKHLNSNSDSNSNSNSNSYSYSNSYSNSNSSSTHITDRITDRIFDNNQAINLVTNDRKQISINFLNSPVIKPFDLNNKITTTELLMNVEKRIEPICEPNLIRPEEYKKTRYSGIGRYRCPWPDCGYTPHFLRDLRRHMHKHTGDKKHKCNVQGCDFVSVWKTSLLQHQRKKHFISIPAN